MKNGIKNQLYWEKKISFALLGFVASLSYCFKYRTEICPFMPTGSILFQG